MRYYVESAGKVRSEALSIEELADWVQAGRIAATDAVVGEDGVRDTVGGVLEAAARRRQPGRRVDPFGIIQEPLECGDAGRDEGGEESPSEADAPPSIEAPPLVVPPYVASDAFRKPTASSVPVVASCVAAAVFLVCCGLLVPAFMRVWQQSETMRPRANATSHLKLLAEAVQMYEDDNDGRFPPAMSSERAAMPYIGAYLPYVSGSGASGHVVVGNAALAGVDASLVRDPIMTVMFADIGDLPDGGHMVAYVDGTVRWVPDFQVARDMKKPALLKKPKP
jgi:hypothetical protein